MKRVSLATVVLLAACAPVAFAQQQRVTIRSQVGVFTSALPLVAVADGYNQNVQLGAAPLIGLDLELAIARGVALYGGGAAVFTRLHHSGAMELESVDGEHSSRAALFASTGGLLMAMPLGVGALRPALRVGAGAKIYNFDLHHARSPVIAPTGDIGATIEVGSGPVRFFTEARWLPSRFDARLLPIRTTGNHRQLQHDWALQVGFRARP
jgi:hypothetical protein